MFWKSIIGGLAILIHWQVWVAAIIYMAVTFSYQYFWLFWVEKNEARVSIERGLKGYMIGGIVLEGILMALMIAFLLPILLGGSSVTPISELIPLSWPIVKAGAIAILAVTILSLLPIIGGLMAHSPAIETFVEGVIIFRLFSEYSVNRMLTEANV